MENESLQRRSTAITEHMGVNSHSIFGAQGDPNNDKLTILPVLQDTHSINQAQHTHYDEQLSTSNSTMNWDMESNYICPTVNNNYVHLTDCVLQTNPSTTIIQNPQTTKLNNDEEIQHDGLGHTISQQSIGTPKQNFTNFANTDLNSSKVIRLVRAKQATKRKSSLDTLIEVVQKELLRVNGQTNSNSPPSSPPPSHYSQTRATTSSKQFQQQTRSIISTVLPSSHPSSLTSQSNQSFKTTRKRINHHHLNNTKRMTSNRNRNKSFNNEELTDEIDLIDEDELYQNHHEQQQQQSNEVINTSQSSSTVENIEEIVRDTVDKLVAITLLNNAPFIVNMITGTPGNTTNTNIETKPLINPSNTNTTKSLPIPASSDYYRNDLALLSSTASELRNSMQQISPTKQQIVLQSTPTTTQTDANKSSTVFVTPRILNFQTVVPKPTTNLQIGNTKIILVSPTTNPPPHHQQQQTLINNSPVKLVKLTSTLPKNVQIVIPSRTSNESLSTIRPLSTLTTCSIDQIPQAAQEVTITTSPNLNKPRRRSSSTTPIDKPVGKILRPIAKVLPVYTPNNSNHVNTSSSTITTNSGHDEIIKPMTVNFQQRPTSTHGPMIYRMTSVNPNVPVFRVRAATAPTSSTIKTDAKPISVTASTSMCYDPKQTHNTTTTGGSVSVLACFKTTKKRTKERAIMPRPSTTDSLDTSHDLQQRLNPINPSSTSTINVPLISTTDDLTNSNSSIFSSPDYRSQSASNRLNLSTKFSDKKSSSNIHLISIDQQQNDLQPAMEDKSIQCIDDHENSTDQLTHSSTKRNGQANDESWTVAADALLRNVLSQYGFRFLDVNCQQNLSAKFDIIQANLVSGMISSQDEFYKSVVEIKENLLKNGLSKISADNLEKLFHYFEIEYPKIHDDDSMIRTNERKRPRRQ
jgi:hypothetical protein